MRSTHVEEFDHHLDIPDVSIQLTEEHSHYCLGVTQVNAEQLLAGPQGVVEQ